MGWLVNMKFCYHCMAEINDDEARFCPQCGNEYDVHYSQSFELPAGTILNNYYFNAATPEELTDVFGNIFKAVSIGNVGKRNICL